MWLVFFLLRAFYRFISCFCCLLVFKSLIFIVFPFVLFVRLFVSHCYRCLFCVCQCLFPFKTVWYAAFNVYRWLVPVYRVRPQVPAIFCVCAPIALFQPLAVSCLARDIAGRTGKQPAVVVTSPCLARACSGSARLGYPVCQLYPG